MRWRPTSGSGPCSRTSSVSLPDRGCRSSSDGSWSTTRPSASAIARRERSKTTREPGTCRRSSAELVGRETEIAAVSDLLASQRLVEIVGPGGIGKTAVAIATGRRLAESDGGAPGGVWLARLETATTADDVLDTVIAALHVTGGEAALLERLKASAAVRDPRQLRARARRCRGARGPPARRRPGATDPVHQPGPARRRRRGRARAHAAGAPRGRGAVHPPSRRTPPGSAAGEADDAVHDLCRSLDGLPLAIELAAARTKTLVDRGDQPPPRRPLQRAERPDQPQAGAPPRAEGHDPVELRAALPRRPAGPVGAGHVRRRRAAPRGRVRARGARRSRVGGDRRRRDGSRAARSSSSTTKVRPFGTGCSTASARSRSTR